MQNLCKKAIIHNLKKKKKSSFGHVTNFELSRFKQMVRVIKIKSLLFCLRDDPLIVSLRQNHVTFIFIKTMSHDLFVQVAYPAFEQPELRDCAIITERGGGGG